MFQNISISILMVFACAQASSAMIDDGLRASKGQFPSVVKIGTYHKFLSFEFSASLCTGTLLGPRTVLTASHCVNHDDSKIQRISQPGDARGSTGRKLFGLLKGGLKVKKAVFSNEYAKVEREYKKASTVISSANFEQVYPSDRQQEMIRAINRLGEKMISVDMAFLILEEPVDSSNIQFPKLSCEGLRVRDPIMFVGFGKNHSASAGLDEHGEMINLNSNYRLNYGHNIVAATGETYLFEYIHGEQLPNNGDSGGPLFWQDSQDLVYGGLSHGYQFKNLPKMEKSHYFSTSSNYARSFYRGIIANKNTPKELRDIVEECL